MPPESFDCPPPVHPRPGDSLEAPAAAGQGVELSSICPPLALLPLVASYSQEPGDSSDHRFCVDVRMDSEVALFLEPEDFARILLDAARIALDRVQDTREGK